MIVIIVIFLVCQTPAFVNQLVYVIGVADACGLPYYYYYHFSNIIVSANSAVNFVVYCVFRRQFRRRLREFCGCAERQEHSADGPREPWAPNMKISLTNLSHASVNSHSRNRVYTRTTTTDVNNIDGQSCSTHKLTELLTT